MGEGSAVSENSLLERVTAGVIKHSLLRLIPWLNGYTPFKFVTFPTIPTVTLP
jgi:hypothetical protein